MHDSNLTTIYLLSSHNSQQLVKMSSAWKIPCSDNSNCGPSNLVF